MVNRRHGIEVKGACLPFIHLDSSCLKAISCNVTYTRAVDMIAASLRQPLLAQARSVIAPSTSYASSRILAQRSAAAMTSQLQKRAASTFKNVDEATFTQRVRQNKDGKIVLVDFSAV